MSVRSKLVAGNWKMNGTRASLAAWLDALVQWPPGDDVSLALFPPAVLLPLIKQPGLHTGGQDISEHAAGAYTGELAAAQLIDAGCSHVLVGHSERRQYHHEDNDCVARKFVAAQQGGLVPVLCVGESLAQRDAGETDAVVLAQVQAVIELAGIDAFAEAVIAYEPVWAIGTGRTASPEQAQEVHALIRGMIAKRSVRIADSLLILYGGSMKPDNAQALLSQPDIDGGLIGGASLKANDFLAIAGAARAVKAVN